MRPCKVPSGPGRRTGLVWSGASRGGAEADSGWAPAALGVPSSSTVALGKGGSQTSAPPSPPGWVAEPRGASLPSVAGAPRPVGQQAGCPRPPGRQKGEQGGGWRARPGRGVGDKGNNHSLVLPPGSSEGWPSPVSRQLPAGLPHSQPQPTQARGHQPGHGRACQVSAGRAHAPPGRAAPPVRFSQGRGPSAGQQTPTLALRPPHCALRCGPLSLARVGPATRDLPSPSLPRY